MKEEPVRVNPVKPPPVALAEGTRAKIPGENISPGATITKPILDEIFGQPVPPSRVDRGEGTTTPRSLHALDRRSGQWLYELMKVTVEGLGVSRYVYCEMPILWVVDEHGTIWFAVEEVISATTNRFSFPRLRNTAVSTDYFRLGHPALIKAAEGRIGGEILFDVEGTPPCWYISNGSGRYGIVPGRTEQHLINVRQRFSEFGIDLREYFIPVGK